MLTPEDVVQVTDFGLAKARAETMEEGERPPGHTLLAIWGGMTPAYCSPEQADIEAKKKARVPREQWPKLTRGTDVWSWAASVLAMFHGRVTWPSGSGAGHYLKRAVQDPRILAMPPAVIELLARCFQRQPEDRPRTLLRVAAALREIYQRVTGQPRPGVAEAGRASGGQPQQPGAVALRLGKTGEGGTEVAGGVDVWAMAASLYNMLTGEGPRDFSKGGDPWLTVLEEPLVPILRRKSSLPQKLAEVIDRALVEEPTIPFQTAAAFKEALESALMSFASQDR